MKGFITVISLAALVSLAACSKGPNGNAHLTESEERVIKSSVINRFNAMIKYSEAGELENVLMHFDPAGGGSYIDRVTRYATLQDMIDNYRATWKIKSQDYGIPHTEVHVLSREFVLVTSSSTLNTTNRDGVTFQPRPWTITTLWTLKDGEWLIHSFDQFDGELAPVEAVISDQ